MLTTKQSRYLIEPMEDGIIVWNADTSATFLYVSFNGFQSKSHSSWMDRKKPCGMEIFDTVAKETSVVQTILSQFLKEVDKRRDGILVLDGTDYDGTGVELPMQFGFMTAGMLMNISEMSTRVLPAKVFSDIDGHVTICSDMEYVRKKKGQTFTDIRTIRLGSGLGFDEALENARGRIEGLMSDICDIEELVFESYGIGERQ